MLIILLHHSSLVFQDKRMRLVFLLGVLALMAASITTETEKRGEVERSQVCIRERISFIPERGLCPSEDGHFPTFFFIDKHVKAPAPANFYELVSAFVLYTHHHHHTFWLKLNLRNLNRISESATECDNARTNTRTNFKTRSLSPVGGGPI